MQTTPSTEACTRAFTLAALATSYPNDESASILAQLQDELWSHPGLGPLLTAAEGGLELLQTAYARLFDTGQARVPLYETEYGRMRGLAKGKDLADVVGFYKAFGFDLIEEDGAEMADHLAVELEFYALLLHKQALLRDDPEGTEIVARARKAFLKDHLGSFPRAVASQGTVAQDLVWGPLLAWCASLVEEECRVEGVEPAPLDVFAATDEEAEVSCGACVTLPDPKREKANDRGGG